MMRALWSSASGMTAQQKHIDVIANNIANVNTTGFKKETLYFQDLVYQTLRPAGAMNMAGTQLPVGIEIGHGTRLVATPRIFSPGGLQETENKLDMAIEGPGFFQVRLPDGNIGYTRSGFFRQDGNGQLVTPEGLLLDPPVIIPPEIPHTNIFITADGNVLAQRPDQTDQESMGSIQLALFPNPAGLGHMGGGIYQPTSAAGNPIVGAPGTNGLGMIKSGALEMSNVQIVDEMVALIVAQRAYEVNSKSIQTADEMLGIANGLRR